MAVSQKADSNQLTRKNSLILGIELDDLQLIKKCVEQGADVNESWVIGQHSIFTKAVEKGNIEIIRYLLENGAKITNGNAKNKSTPLVLAIRNNCSLELVELLVQKGADVNEADVSGRSPLNEALTLNKTEVVQYLLTHGADVDRSDGSGRKPICLAVTSDNLEVVQLLVSHGAKISAVDSKGNNAWSLAQRSNHLGILNYLESRSNVQNNLSCPPTRRISFQRNEVSREYNSSDEVWHLMGEEAAEEEPSKIESTNNSKNGNDKPSENKVNTNGLTPLAEAVQCEKIEDVKYLLALKVNTCEAVDGKTPLLMAVEKENVEIIRLLLEHGAEHTIQTALLESIKLSNLDIVRFLIQKGAILNLIYKSGHTPLTQSIETKNFDIVKQLVESGADVNFTDGGAHRPLAASLDSEDVTITEYLIEKGATLSQTMDKTLIQKYVENNNLQMIRILSEMMKIKFDVIFDNGHSVLTQAVEARNLEIIKYLVENNICDINGTNGNEQTALAIASINQDLPVIKYLISARADVTLAKEEFEECQRRNEDFALYLKYRLAQ